jgi:hypothetical protein
LPHHPLVVLGRPQFAILYIKSIYVRCFYVRIKCSGAEPHVASLLLLKQFFLSIPNKRGILLSAI